jgi:3-oxoacyl-[acyl-carrier protein] reductase
MDLKDVKVLITGGSSGIGFETAKLLKSQGAEVVICGRNAAKLNHAAKVLGVHALSADVSIETQVLSLFNDTLKIMPDLNVLVNNAGIGHIGALVDTSVAEFESVWQTNVKGAFLVGREAAKHFIKQNSGNIINIGSTSALKGSALGSAYVASKFALNGMTECWRTELRRYNIRVMQINPSEVITDFAAKLQIEPTNQEKKLKGTEIAHVVSAMLSMNDVGFITDAAVWATNP